MTPSRTHLVVIPTYNTGAPLLERTVWDARAAWNPVWVVVDGSTDGSADALAGADPSLCVLVSPDNRGKGAAVRRALLAAEQAGFTHALVMDADGQHPAPQIAEFMAASMAAPGHMVLGRPVFGPDAPLLRVRGRRISNWWARLETLGAGVDDSLFGFRVYPIAALNRVMAGRGMRGFDFDPAAVVRLTWAGIPALNVPAPVRYLRPEQGGVSHFQYRRDNLLLIRLHTRLVFGMLRRLPGFLMRGGAWR